MIKLKLDKEIKDLNDNPIVFDTVNNEVMTVRSAFCAILGVASTKDFITGIDLGLKIKNAKGKEIELSSEDVVFLKSAVKDCKYIDVVKYRLTKELE